jgi:N-acetylglucosaminyldiphosphoundecaprenol N-acetyl-beta-D-mannosaminyltransferase
VPPRPVHLAHDDEAADPETPLSEAPDGPAAVPLLGTAIHAVTREQALQRIAELVRRPPCLVVTPNVDHVVLLRRDAAFRLAYEAAALRVCDGAPLVGLSRLCGSPLPERVTGADLMGDVCGLAAERGWRVFIAGGAPDVLEKGLRQLRGRFPDLDISGHSPPLAFEGTAHDDELQEVLRAARPDIVMVCLGAPRAEIWAAAHMAAAPAVYLCVGAAIDFAAGARRRAPELLQRLGLEWLYRLSQEPRRLWQRYLIRDVVFLPLALRELWLSGERRSSRTGRGPGRSQQR